MFGQNISGTQPMQPQPMEQFLSHANPNEEEVDYKSDNDDGAIDSSLNGLEVKSIPSNTFSRALTPEKLGAPRSRNEFLQTESTRQLNSKDVDAVPYPQLQHPQYQWQQPQPTLAFQNQLQMHQNTNIADKNNLSFSPEVLNPAQNRNQPNVPQHLQKKFNQMQNEINLNQPQQTLELNEGTFANPSPAKDQFNQTMQLQGHSGRR